MPLTPQKFLAYLRLMRLDKPIGSLLLLWPTLWALWFAAHGRPAGYLLGVFCCGTLLMRSAGCVINDIADRNFDRHVARTRERPITTGEISVKNALCLFSALLLAAFLLIIPLISPLFLAIACAAVFLAVSYPYTKRFLALPQAYLGIAFGFGIPLAYAAVQNTVPLEAWLLLLANIFWAIAYDTEYAMVDRADDLKIGIRTSAISFGRYDVTMVMLCYALSLGLLAVLAAYQLRGGFFYAGLLVAASIAVYHFYLIRARDPARCFKAFRHNNWFGASIFIGLAFDFWV